MPEPESQVSNIAPTLCPKDGEGGMDRKSVLEYCSEGGIQRPVSLWTFKPDFFYGSRDQEISASLLVRDF